LYNTARSAMYKIYKWCRGPPVDDPSYNVTSQGLLVVFINMNMSDETRKMCSQD